MSLFAALAGRRALLAVSGGPDSIALMRLAAQWQGQGAPAGTSFFVATVDHGLRSESRAEAETVGRWAQSVGLAHQTLIWQGAKPRTRVQERARAARYALLRAHAQSLGADYLLTGHHADDQAETILFRLMRGSGIGGLAGMQSMTEQDGVVLYRPLLGVPKKLLIDYCNACNQPYFRDPSNENLAFARTRLREILPLLDEAGLDAAGLARLGRRTARAERALAAQADLARATLKRTSAPDIVHISAASLRDLPEEILLRVVGVEIAALGSKPPRLERLESLAQDLCAALQLRKVWHRTLGGVKLSLDGEGLTLQREALRRRGGVSASAHLASHDPAFPRGNAVS
ncbi:MAG: tRNA lysidine(34) synthetase TilS [Methylovirgula sp.]|uniref:tRNA lysidine(34) synthetase TilS n=1 Tax=Methylovirgula sp. TaxID=1978224 RepID=UPI003075F992